MSKDRDFFNRLRDSAKDFVVGVQPIIESNLNVEIHPIEDLGNRELVKKLDHRGVDAFYFEQDGQTRALASRVNSSQWAKDGPRFTFRYRKKFNGRWDDNLEFIRKCKACESPPEEFLLFPKLHVESYSVEKGKGKITWSCMVETKSLLKFMCKHFHNTKIIQSYFPTNGEPREVLWVSVEAVARECEVHELKG